MRPFSAPAGCSASSVVKNKLIPFRGPIPDPESCLVGILPADAKSYGPRAASEALRPESAAGGIPPKVGLSPAEAPFIEGKPRRADRLG